MKDYFNTKSFKSLDEMSQMVIDTWTFIVLINLSKWHPFCHVIRSGYSAWSRVLQCIKSVEVWSLIPHGLKDLYSYRQHTPSKCCNHKPIRWKGARRRAYPPLLVLWGKELTFVFQDIKGMVTYQQMLLRSLLTINCMTNFHADQNKVFRFPNRLFFLWWLVYEVPAQCTDYCE